jgi:hypothetical protein
VDTLCVLLRDTVHAVQVRDMEVRLLRQRMPEERLEGPQDTLLSSGTPYEQHE